MQVKGFVNIWQGESLHQDPPCLQMVLLAQGWCLLMPGSHPFLPSLDLILSFIPFLCLLGHPINTSMLQDFPFNKSSGSIIPLLLLPHFSEAKPIKSCACSPMLKSSPPEPILSNQASSFAPLKCFCSRSLHVPVLHTQWSFSALIFPCLPQHLADGLFSFGHTFFP